MAKVIYSDNGTLSDFSTNLAKYQSGTETFSFVAAEDYFYIGNRLPFNHFYVKIGSTANTTTTNMSLQYWNGDEWISVVELEDQTDGFKQSGFVSFVPDKEEHWQREDTKDKSGELITGLGSITVYDNYWIRVGFNSDMDSNVILSWLGQKFSDDEDLGAEYPSLDRSSMKTAFESGKTDWEEQHIRAAEIIVQDLIKKRVVSGGGQILKRDEFKLPAVCKVAELIYTAFGDDYNDDKQRARQEYGARMDQSVFSTDQNLDGRLSISEEFKRVGFLKR